MFSFLIFWGVGSAALGFLLAWFLQKNDENGNPQPAGQSNGKKSKNSNDPNKAQKELDKIKKRYDFAAIVDELL